MTGLTIRTSFPERGMACVALNGVLDGWTSARLDREVTALLESGPSRIAFDLGQLDLMTSAGAGVFVGAVEAALERGGGIALISPCPAVRHVLEVLGLTGMLPIADDLASAAQQLASKRSTLPEPA